MPAKKPRSIVIVEDEAGLRTALSRMFLHEGYEVITASDGREGLALVEKALPDLVISDVVMPNLDGVSMVQALRANLWGCAVPVIFYTNYPCSLFKEVQEKLSVGICLPKADTSLSDLLRHAERLIEDRSRLKQLTGAVTAKFNIHKI